MDETRTAGSAVPIDVQVSGCVASGPNDLVRDGWGHAPTLVLGSFADARAVGECLQAGAMGYVHQEAALPTIFEAIRSVASGRRFVAETAQLNDFMVHNTQYPLSPRELQVLTCIAQGRTHHQVARILGISSHTVDTYVKRARSKLGLGNKADLTRAALFSGSGHGSASGR